MNDKRDDRLPHFMRLRSQARPESLTPSEVPAQTPMALLHELQVHQVELEMQNEELLRTNLELEASRNRYLDLYEFAPVGYVTLTNKSRISEISLNGAVLLADERAHLLQCNFGSLVAPKDGDRWHHHFQSTLQSGGKHTLELTLQRRNGTQFQARLNSIRLETTQDAPSVRIAITDINDVAELKRAVAESQIAAIVFESQQGMVITDEKTVVIRVNKAFVAISGYSEQEAVGQPLQLLKSGRHDSAFFDEMWERIEHTGSWQGEICDQRKSGETFPSFVTVTGVYGENRNVTHYVCTVIDITKRKEAEKEIQSLAFYDPLTRLPNRRLLLDRLRHALTASNRSKREGALMFIDLDDFKTLNDTLGHDIGDQLLVQVAEKLSVSIREGDTVARLGGDEFVVILEDLNGNAEECATQAEHVGEKILASVNQINLVNGHPLHTAASIGVTLFNDHESTLEELMKRADLAMYQAKAAGRNNLRFFDSEMQAVVTARAKMETELRGALLRKEFLLYLQPQVNHEGNLIGFEALVRWKNRMRGIVSPNDFISEIEKTGMIGPLGLWVLEIACAQLVAWSAHPRTANLSLAINVSARQFQQPDFVEQVMTVLDRSGANPRNLKLELTESALLDDVNDTIFKMNSIKERGVRFSLDDFGIGFASLSYLKRLPFNQVKIDQSFIQNILTDSNDAAIAKMIITLAQTMNIEVIAEGVETEEQRDFLLRNGCQTYQGFLFSPPLPQELIANLMSQPNSANHSEMSDTSSILDIKPRWERRFKPVEVEVDRRRASLGH